MICQFGEIPFRPLGEENLARFSDITKPLLSYAEIKQSVFNLQPEGGMINELVLEISPYDFLFNGARLHKSQKCDMTELVFG